VINLSWNGVTGATSYTVQRAPHGSTSWSTITTTAATTYADSVGTAANNDYRVLATNATATSLPSNVATASTSLAASYDVSAVPTAWTRGQTKTYSVTVTNCGSTTWPSGGGNPVHLGIHLAQSGGGFGNNVWYTDQRFPLPSIVAAGSSVTLSVTVTLPGSVDGTMVLEHQMVQEGVSWFPEFADVGVTISP
jgi:hypothetical protein